MHRLALGVLTLFSALVLSSLSDAQSHTWDGGSDNWSTPKAWTPDSVPNDPAH